MANVRWYNFSLQRRFCKFASIVDGFKKNIYGHGQCAMVKTFRCWNGFVNLHQSLTVSKKTYIAGANVRWYNFSLQRRFCKFRRIERASAHGPALITHLKTIRSKIIVTAIAQKFPTPDFTIIFSISATLQWVNALNMTRAKPSGSEKVAVDGGNIFGSNVIFFLPQKVWPGLETGCWRHVGVLKLKILLWASMLSK